MTSSAASAFRAEPNPFTNDPLLWEAVVRRDPRADGRFVTAVVTTGVYCRPTCPARRPKRENVAFYPDPATAEQAGFRPCKRCRPDGLSPREEHAGRIARACRLIEEAEEPPPLGRLAADVGLSPHHFHRLFKAALGVTPRAYAAARRADRVRDGLKGGAGVTEALYDAGFNSGGRFYEAAPALLGMTPAAYKGGGRGEAIRYAVEPCALGWVLVAATARGVCAIRLGDGPGALVDELRDRFPKAELHDADPAFGDLVGRVVAFVERPGRGLDLPLDIRGTAFQERVWRALRAIPTGETASYAEIARRVGSPAAVRAVAGACGANPVALAVPCHRVVRSGGGLGGYRWGTERKRELLRREAER